MPRRTETWEGCRWTRIDPLVNVVPSEPTVHQLLFREKRTVVGGIDLVRMQLAGEEIKNVSKFAGIYL